MRPLNNALSCAIAFSLFIFAGQLKPQEPKAEREGPVYRSIFLGEDNLRVEITSALFVREDRTADAPKTYIYSYFIKNGGNKKVKLELLSHSARPGSPPVIPGFELEAGESSIASVESKVGPKKVPVSQMIKVSDGKGNWVTEGFNFSFVYVPDIPSGEKKNDLSNDKNTV